MMLCTMQYHSVVPAVSKARLHIYLTISDFHIARFSLSSVFLVLGLNMTRVSTHWRKTRLVQNIIVRRLYHSMLVSVRGTFSTVLIQSLVSVLLALGKHREY